MSDWEAYQRAVGEMYARDSQMRAMMPDSMRRDKTPLAQGGRVDGNLIKPSESLAFTGPISDDFAPTLYLQRLLEKEGHAPEVAATIAQTVQKVQKMLGVDSVAWKELKALDPSDPRIGAFVKMSDGSRLIALRMLSQEHSEALAVGRVTHELAHDMWDQYRNGKLAPEHQEAFASLEKAVKNMGLAGKKELLSFIHDEVLPRNLRGDDLKESVLLEQNLNDDNEVMANTLGMLSHVVAAYRPETVFEKIKGLPVSMMNGVRSLYRYIRDNFKTMRQFQFFKDFGNNIGVDTPMDIVTKFTKSLTDSVKHITAMDSVLADQARFTDLQHGAMQRMMQEAESNPLWLHQLDANTRHAAEFMSLKNMSKGMREAVENVLPPINNAHADPRLDELTALPNVESAHMHSWMRRAQNVLYAVNPDQKTGPMVMDTKKGAVARVNRDPVALLAAHNLMRYAQERGDMAIANGAEVGPTVFDHIAKGDANVKAMLATVPTEEMRKNVLEYIARHQKVQEMMPEDFRHSRTQILSNVLSATLLSRTGLQQYSQAKSIADQAIAEATQYRAAGQSQQMNTTLAGVAGGDANLATALSSLVRGGMDVIDQQYNTMKARPYFITEQRYKRYHVAFKKIEKVADETGAMKDTTRTGLAAFDTPEQAREFMAAVDKDSSAKLISKQPVDSFKERGGGNVDYQPIKEHLQRIEDKSIDEASGILQSLGATPEQLEQIKNLISTVPDIEEYEGLNRLGGPLKINRDFKPGRDALDMGAQQTNMLGRMARMLTRQVSDSAVMAMRRDSTIYNDATKPNTDRIEQALQNYRVGDSKAMRFVSTAGYLWYTASNISNAVYNQSSFVLSLVPQLVEEGASLLGAYRHVGSAAKLMFERGMGNALSAEQERLLQRADQSGRVGFWDGNQIADNESAAGDPDRPGQAKGVARTLMQVASLPFRLGTHYNDSVSLLASWDMVRGKMFGEKVSLTDKEFDQVFERATRIAGMTTANFGKVNRPTALFSGDNNLWKTSAAMVYNLQAFSAGLYANVLRQAHRGFGDSLKGVLTPAERTASKKAFATSLLSLTSLAGLAGVPMLMPLVKLWEQATGQDVETAMSETVKALGDHFGGAPVGDFASQVAQHGFLHAMGLPVDISQRVSPGGLFGFNSYNGFDSSKLLGAVPGIATNLYASLQAAEVGDWSKAFEKGLPPTLGRLVQAAGSSIDNSSGRPVVKDPSWAQKAAFLMGFQPREAVVRNDAASLVKRVNASAKLEDAKLTEAGSQLLERGDNTGLMQLLAATSQQRGTTFNPSQALEAMLSNLEAKQFPADSRDQTTLHGSDIFDRLRGKELPAQQASVMQRLMWRNQLRLGVTGEPYGADRFQHAMGIDQLREQHPDISTVRASEWLRSLNPRATATPFSKNPFELMAGVGGQE